MRGHPRIRVGTRFGRLRVVSMPRVGQYVCRCDCGAGVVARGSELRSGKRRSCGCLLRAPVVRIGDRYGRLIVEAEVRCEGYRIYRCRCDCGGSAEVKSSDLARGRTRSCGCLARDILRERLPQLSHGHARSGSGRSGTYISWQSMVARCTNPNRAAWPRYGGRGIRVCDRWGSFENFLADMGERPTGMTLDRIDPDGNYEPGNCRWADDSSQARDRGRSLAVTPGLCHAGLHDITLPGARTTDGRCRECRNAWKRARRARDEK